ncbi:MAG: hypothetical protein HDR07_00885 [Lachnospiraceae bacterium]|nr:hypothetical protein [Lachnospiraceae bacterium]
MKNKVDKIKIFIKKYWILCIVIFFIMIPLLLNVGLYITDIIFNKYGLTLTANGLENKDWLAFLSTYLSVVIAFVGICLAWESSNADRKREKNEKLAQEYGEDIKEEKNVLIEVCQSFNTDIAWKIMIELDNPDTKECKRTLQNAREQVLNAQVKFELLTDIADNFQKCEKCNFNPCYDKENMIAIRDLYYKMENLYFDMLENINSYIDKFDQQRIDKNKISINEKLVINNEEMLLALKQRIIYEDEVKMQNTFAEIQKIEQEISCLNFEINALKKQEIDVEKMNELAKPIIELINVITQEMKPKMISYCKSYIGWKKRHKEELFQDGTQRFVRFPECSEILKSQE